MGTDNDQDIIILLYDKLVEHGLWNDSNYDLPIEKVINALLTYAMNWK